MGEYTIKWRSDTGYENTTIVRADSILGAVNELVGRYHVAHIYSCIPMKQPWQMTRSEWIDYKALCLINDILAGRGPWKVDKLGYHIDHIRQAQTEGLPIPAKVLADYL